MREILGPLAWALIPLASAACIPDAPRVLLDDVAVLQHPAVVAALETVQQSLADLAGTTADSFSVGIVSCQGLTITLPNP